MSFEARKFYADDLSAYPSISSDVLAAMASQGVKTEPDGAATVPDIQLAAAPSTEAEKPPTAAAPSTTAASAQEAPIKTQEAAAPIAPAPPPVVDIPAIPQVDWREQIKKVDGSDILKELGYDEKLIGFFNKWRADGDISEYIRAVSVDFGKMTPEQLMKYQLEQNFPEFSPADLEELYQAKVVEAYKLDPNAYSETEVKRGRLMLQADAKAVRESMQQKQREYTLSAKAPAPVVDNSAQEAEAHREQLRTQYTNYLTGHQSTKELLANKRLILGEGENAFNYEVADPQEIITILQQPEQYARHVFNEDGTPIVDKQLLIGLIAKDHVGVINRLIKYGRDLGAKAMVDQMENAKKPTGDISKVEGSSLTPAEALAKSGVITSYS